MRLQLLDDDVLKRFAEHLSAHGLVDLSRSEASGLVLTWVRERRPAAVVRFGEGEGRLLAADHRDPESIEVAKRKIRRQTGLVVSDVEVLAIGRSVMHAFDSADLVGIRGSRSFSAEHKTWVDRLGRLLEDRIERGRVPAYVSHSLLNHDLTDALPQLLVGQDIVSVISCRDVRPLLTSRYNVPDVRVYQIPSQYIMRNIDGPYEAVFHDVPLWPDFYAQLCSRLTVRKTGEVFLVGAGLFGKDLCIRIRDLGGIALDLGSSLDSLASKVTRGPNRPEPYRRSTSAPSVGEKRKRIWGWRQR